VGDGEREVEGDREADRARGEPFRRASDGEREADCRRGGGGGSGGDTLRWGARRPPGLGEEERRSRFATGLPTRPPLARRGAAELR
jgi:hypothetical protein